MLPVASILVDFDGTASSHDVAEHLLIEFADPSWVGFDDAWLRGELDSRRVIDAQAAMLEAPLEELLDFVVEHCALDVTFPPFVRWSEGEGVPVTLVSDGFGFYIPPLLEAAGLDHVSVITNTWAPSDGVTMGYGNGHPTCIGCGTCKMNAVFAAREHGRVAFVGDGASDRYAALYSDVVFAKDALVEIATADEVPFFPWTSFDDVRAHLEGGGEIPGPVDPTRCPAWRIA